ncbi:MAG: BlaI/MecI/CopY family transcriptional regulator [Balneolales bacterium]
MAKLNREQLSRRERQIMDIIYQLGQATVSDVREQLPDPPGYSAVRAMLNILEEKKCLKHTQNGPKYVYSPTENLQKVKRNVLKHMIDTFFNGSAENAVAMLLDVSQSDLKEEDLDRLAKLIENFKKEE